MKIEVKTLNSIIIYNQWRIYGLRGGGGVQKYWTPPREKSKSEYCS